jgi:hypothetical protein
MICRLSASFSPWPLSIYFPVSYDADDLSLPRSGWNYPLFGSDI